MSEQQSSWLIVEELFAAGDERFLDALRAFHIPGRLAVFAERWGKDGRPWARQQILRYLRLPLNATAHETVVKRLFKSAEKSADDELMAAFAVAFDQLVRRRLATDYQYDWQTGQTTQFQVLRSPRNQLPHPPRGNATDRPIQPSWEPFPWESGSPKLRLFSYHTRYYLRRRAWRYFRHAGYRRPADYVGAVARTLAGYRDEDLASGANILDSWSLLHACFGESDVLEFGATHAKVRDGRALRELTPAPQFPDLWKSAGAARVLIDLIVSAQSHLVRTWAIQLLRREHAESIKGMSIRDVRRLLDHDDADVQLLGAELLENLAGLERLPVETWLELLETRNLTALETIAQLMARHVTPGRLTLEQCVKLACVEPAPVARLGFNFLKDRPLRRPEEFDAITDLANARCAAIGTALAEWAMTRLLAEGTYSLDRVSRFFDSLLREVREGAWAAMVEASPAWNDPGLWSRLIETPYDDVRLRLVSALEQRGQAPGMAGDRLAALWSSVLLGIHRGGRRKLTALRQISDAVRNEPQHAEVLLPALCVAIRSVRAPEARAGLAAVVGAVDARPELTELVARWLPELQLNPEEASA